MPKDDEKNNDLPSRSHAHRRRLQRWSEGKTEEEALENIKDAIQMYLEVIAENTKGSDIREVQVA
jgi:hypothetical protein